MPAFVVSTGEAPPDHRHTWIQRLARLGEGKRSRHRNSLCKSWDARRQGAFKGVKEDQCNQVTDTRRRKERRAGALEVIGKEYDLEPLGLLRGA